MLAKEMDFMHRLNVKNKVKWNEKAMLSTPSVQAFVCFV